MRHLLKTILIFLFALAAYAAVHPRVEENAVSSVVPNGNITASRLPDGRRKLVFTDGKLEFTVVETLDGKATIFDPTGKEITDLAVGLTKRQTLWQRVAMAFAGILQKWGVRAWNFLYCIGLDAGWKCSQKFVECANRGTPPWKCVGGLACVGAGAKRCI